MNFQKFRYYRGESNVRTYRELNILCINIIELSRNIYSIPLEMVVAQRSVIHSKLLKSPTSKDIFH